MVHTSSIVSCENLFRRDAKYGDLGNATTDIDDCRESIFRSIHGGTGKQRNAKSHPDRLPFPSMSLVFHLKRNIRVFSLSISFFFFFLRFGKDVLQLNKYNHLLHLFISVHFLIKAKDTFKRNFHYCRCLRIVVSFSQSYYGV